MAKADEITVYPLIGHDIHSVTGGDVLLTLEIVEDENELQRRSGRVLPVIMTAAVARELAQRLIEAGIYGAMTRPKSRLRP